MVVDIAPEWVKKIRNIWGWARFLVAAVLEGKKHEEPKKEETPRP